MSNEPENSVQSTVGKLIVVSGPSGAGKSTIVKALVQRCPLPLVLSVSATTRPPRPGEQHGKDYWFLSPDEFERRRLAGDFLECFEVFRSGFWYGTLRNQVTAGINQGNWVILEIDVQGAREIMKQFPDCISVFLDAGTIEELERRLVDRNTESPESIRRRLAIASEEIGQSTFFQHRLSNRNVDETVADFCRLLGKT
ncbi:MAG TPA: guanylate kinase [Pirellulaceae bacterium]|nr:guanylate kinase [Pirellulaceae bacterium]